MSRKDNIAHNPSDAIRHKQIYNNPAPGEVGSGDMLKSIYDPTGIGGDAFDSANTNYDNSTSGAVSSKVEGAIDESYARIKLLEGTGAYTTYTDPILNAITVSDVDDYRGVVITLTAAGNDQTLPSPTDVGRFHEFTVINNDTSTDSISIIGTSTIVLDAGKSIKFTWEGTVWVASDSEGIWYDDGSSVKTQNTRDIDLQKKDLANVKALKFDLTNTATPAEGEMCWNDDDGTAQLGMPGGEVVGSIMQELYLPRKVKNTSGIDIKNGNVIYISGGSGVNAEIALATKSDYTKASGTIAVATEDIDDNAFGYCTAFGLVKGTTAQPINTNAAVAGTTIYLDTDGAFTITCPTAPDTCVEIGKIFRKHVTEGIIIVNIEKHYSFLDRDTTKEPTGFTAPEDVIVTGDSTSRTVTLTGTVNAYYKGMPNYDIVTGWTSSAHDNITTKVYALTYNGTDIDWRDLSTITDNDFFTSIIIAIAFYNSNDAVWVYQRECHGLQPWQSHRNDHKTVGTYKDSGGTLSDYVLSSTTVSERRPSVSSALIYDEDLPTTVTALPVNTYTQGYLSGAGGTFNFITTGTDIVPLSANRPYRNEFTGGVWQQTLMSTGDYMNIWLIAIPTAADTESQKLRYIWVQGQAEFDNTTEAAAETPNDVNLGTLTGLTPELVYISKVTIRYIGGNWSFIAVTDLTGTKLSQSQSPTGNYLSAVTSDSTLTGIGTSGDPLSVDTTNIVDGYTTTATADGTTTLTVASTHTQRFTGTLDQNCKAPVTSTLTLGQSYKIVNDSSGTIAAQASDGASEICKVQPGERALITCILLTGTDETSWTYTLVQSESQTTELSQQVSIQSVPDGTVTGGVTDGLISGLTLANLSKVDISTAYTPVGASGFLKPNTADDIISILDTYNVSKQTTNITTSNEIFIYAKTDEITLNGVVGLQYSDDTTDTAGTSTDNLNEVYGTITATKTDLANPYIVDNSESDITSTTPVSFITVNKTALGIHSTGSNPYTEAQMLDLVRGVYFESMANSKNIAVKSVGKNLFDGKIEKKNGYYDLNGSFISSPSWDTYKIEVKGGLTYFKSANFGGNNTFWLNNNFISGSTGSSVTIPSNANYLKIALQKIYKELQNQIEEGSTATAYEPYKYSLFETECELRSVKNATGLTRDTVDAKGDHIKRVKEPTEILSGGTVNTTTYTDAKSGGYYLVLQDDGVIQTGTVGDAVSTSGDGDVIYELASPITTNLVDIGKVSGTMKAFKDGANYQDCTNGKETVTSSAVPDITLIENAISEIIQVTYKNTDDEIVEISPSDLTLSDDGLTITGTTVIPASTLCQVKGYLKYNIPALITGNVAVNLKAVVDSLNEIIGSQSAQITSLQGNQNLILALI